MPNASQISEQISAPEGSAPAGPAEDDAATPEAEIIAAPSGAAAAEEGKPEGAKSPRSNVEDAEEIKDTDVEVPAGDADEPYKSFPRSGHHRGAALAAAVVIGLITGWLGVLHISAQRDDGVLAVADAKAPEEVSAKAALAEVSGALSRELEARAVLESRETALRAELANETAKREQAERAVTEKQSELEAERKARTEAEEAARLAQEALAHAEAAQGPAPAAPAPSAPPPVPQQEASQSPPAVVAATPTEVPEERVRTASLETSANGSARVALDEGRRLFAQGDLAGARAAFGRAARMGLPEGALALGTTYDPVNLARAGLKTGGNPEQARLWYRRAHELARHNPQN